MKRCIIIGAGDLMTEEIPVQKEDYVIAADGGYLYCKYLGLVPDLIIGDLDSLPEEQGQELARIRRIDPERIVVLPTEKDETDMLAAIHAGLDEGCREFYIYGGQGGRLEHTLANIQCLLYLKECGATGYMAGDGSLIFVIKNETVSFREEETGYLSLFSLGEKAEGVTLRNLKYELTDAVITNSFPLGISNEFIGKKASVTVNNGSLVGIICSSADT